MEANMPCRFNIEDIKSGKGGNKRIPKTVKL